MKRTVCLVLCCTSLAFVSTGALGISVTEVGLQFHVMHAPESFDGEPLLGFIVGAYCTLEVADQWTMRLDVWNPLDMFFPQLDLSMTYAINNRMAVEGQLAIQSDFYDSVYMTITGGARVIALASPTTRLSLATFPLQLTGLFSSSGYSAVFPSAQVNLYATGTWAPSEHIVLRQTLGGALIRLDSDAEFVFPLGGPYGLSLSSLTRAGYRP